MEYALKNLTDALDSGDSRDPKPDSKAVMTLLTAIGKHAVDHKQQPNDVLAAVLWYLCEPKTMTERRQLYLGDPSKRAAGLVQDDSADTTMSTPVESEEKDGWMDTREYTCRKCCKKGSTLCPCANEHIQVQKKQIRRADEPERVSIRCKACPDVQVSSAVATVAGQRVPYAVGAQSSSQCVPS